MASGRYGPAVHRRLTRHRISLARAAAAESAEPAGDDGPRNPMPVPARHSLLRDPVGTTPVEDPLGGLPIPAEARSILRRRQGLGDALPDAVSTGMAAELGRSLSAVRVHTDPESDRLARSMQSVAFTQGSDIYFSRGSYAPATTAGSRILAHELAHVAGGSAGPAVIGRADDLAEAAAERSADRIAPAIRRLLREPGSASSPHLAPVPLAAGIGVLQRKMTYTSAHINAHRSKAGVRKGQTRDDTLHKIGKLLDMVGRGFDEQLKDLAGLGAISGLCSVWLDKHKASKNAELIALVRDIKREAKENGIAAQKQQKYLNDMHAGHRVPEGRDGLAHIATTTPFTQQIDQRSLNATTAGKDAKNLHGNKDASDGVFMAFHTHQSWLIRGAGLTEAEILAIKVFTAGDYKYINPAIADDPKWMQSQLQDIQSRMRPGQVADPVKLFEEGKRHAATMLEGLSKLPPIKGTVHRGERMTAEEFARLWKGKRQIDYPSFVSSTTDPAMADGAAAGKLARPDQTVSIRSRFAVTDARDVQGVSSVPAEKECLILPGTSFTVDKIERSKTQVPGNPAATEWWEITLTQKPKAKGGPEPKKKHI